MRRAPGCSTWCDVTVCKWCADDLITVTSHEHHGGSKHRPLESLFNTRNVSRSWRHHANSLANHHVDPTGVFMWGLVLRTFSETKMLPRWRNSYHQWHRKLSFWQTVMPMMTISSNWHLRFRVTGIGLIMTHVWPMQAWWHHHMKTVSALWFPDLCEGNPPVTDIAYKGQLRGALMFS